MLSAFGRFNINFYYYNVIRAQSIFLTASPIHEHIISFADIVRLSPQMRNENMEPAKTRKLDQRLRYAHCIVFILYSLALLLT